MPPTPGKESVQAKMGCVHSFCHLKPPIFKDKNMSKITKITKSSAYEIYVRCIWKDGKKDSPENTLFNSYLVIWIWHKISNVDNFRYKNL